MDEEGLIGLFLNSNSNDKTTRLAFKFKEREWDYSYENTTKKSIENPPLKKIESFNNNNEYHKIVPSSGSALLVNCQGLENFTNNKSKSVKSTHKIQLNKNTSRKNLSNQSSDDELPNIEQFSSLKRKISLQGPEFSQPKLFKHAELKDDDINNKKRENFQQNNAISSTSDDQDPIEQSSYRSYLSKGHSVLQDINNLTALLDSNSVEEETTCSSSQVTIIINENLNCSPSYSPLESPDPSFCFIQDNEITSSVRSEVIELDPNIQKMLHNGIEFIDCFRMNLNECTQIPFKDTENDKIEIILSSNGERDVSSSNYEEFINDLLRIANKDYNNEPEQIQKLQEEPKKIENLETTEDRSKIEMTTTDEYLSFSFKETDFLELFGESLSIVSSLLDSVEQKMQDESVKSESVHESSIEIKEMSSKNTSNIIVDKKIGSSLIKIYKIDKASNKDEFSGKEFVEMCLKDRQNKTGIDETILLSDSFASFDEGVLETSSAITRLTPSNQSVENNVLLEIEQILIKYLRIIYPHLNICQFFSFNDLNLEVSKFLLRENLKKREEFNLNKDGKISKEEQEHDKRLKWLLIINFCFISSDLLFNSCWKLFLNIFDTFKEQYSKIASKY